MPMNGGRNTIKGNEIPGDIIAEILSILPSKSVWRFRLACTTWYSLISDPIFINLHSKRAPQSPKILYSTSRTRCQLQLFDYNSSSFDDCCLSRPTDFPVETRIGRTILGSSCGLVCVATDFSNHSFCIWNPLTKECREIPDLMIYTRNIDYFHGFGYDLVADDFKLVISLDRMRYYIFSLKANSWKTITCPLAFEYYDHDAYQDEYALHGIQPWNSRAIVLNGIFHWLLVPVNGDAEIVAFDVHNESFQKLQIPQHAPPEFYGLANLLEHRGCLCLHLLNSVFTHEAEIWMMNKEMFGGHWVHFLSIKNFLTFDCFRLPVLCISSRSEVDFHTDEKFSRCAREEEDKLDEWFASFPSSYRPVLYVETLISPGADDRNAIKKLIDRLKSLFVALIKFSPDNSWVKLFSISP